jgi:hypothetical protein
MKSIVANALVMRTAHSFAIKRNYFTCLRRLNCSRTMQEAFLKLLHGKRGEHTPKVSCDGMPLGNSRNYASPVCLV